MKKKFNRIQFLCNKIYEFSEIKKETPTLYYKDTEMQLVSETVFQSDEWVEFKKGDVWGTTPDFHCWFYMNVDTAKPTRFDKMRLYVSTGTTDDDWNVNNPQFLVYVNGKLVQALDANHREILLQPCETTEIYLFAYNGLHADSPINMQLSFCEYDGVSDDLYYCVKVLLEIMEYTDVKSKFFTLCISNLEEILGAIDFTLAGTEKYFLQIADAYKKIKEELLPKIKDDFNPTLYAVGSSHLDIAWLWTVRQTREKVCRTAANVLNYMKMFPKYKFFGSQALLYQFLKEEEPSLYNEVKERIIEGRWDVEGA